MSNLVKVDQLKSILSTDDIRKKMKSMLKDRAPQFMVSLTNLFEQDLQKCDPKQVVTCAMVAATLNLPIDKNLGFAYIVPYYSKGKQIPQFQMGYKGFVQLALRTGQYKKITTVPVYKENFNSWNPLTEELDLSFDKEPDYSKKPVGYAAYFKTVNGFEKTVYWSYEKVKAHAEEYSQSYKAFLNGKVYSAIWNDNFDSMALKTVLKNTLSKWGILSIELQKAIEEDQKDANGNYSDNKEKEVEETKQPKSFKNLNEEPEEAEVVDQESGEILDEKSGEKIVDTLFGDDAE